MEAFDPPSSHIYQTLQNTASNSCLLPHGTFSVQLAWTHSVLWNYATHLRVASMFSSLER
jgi:hypothetical protein